MIRLADLNLPLPRGVDGWIEIVILWGIIYAILRFLRGTRGSGVFRGLLFFLGAAIVGISLLSTVFDIARITFLIQTTLPYIAVILAVLFQQEIRQGIARLGHTGFLGFFTQDEEGEETIAKVADAARRMGAERTGALIAFERADSLAAFRENAVKIDAPISSILLESIFFHGNPLHDGGVIIRGGTVQAAAAIFPLTDNPELQRRMGTRHRAGLGISEETDAVALVVSEETGKISLAAAGKLYKDVPPEKVEDYLGQLLRKAWKKKPATEKEAETAETKVVDSVEISEMKQEPQPQKEAATSG